MKFELSSSLKALTFLIIILLIKLIASNGNETESDMIWNVDEFEPHFSGDRLSQNETHFKSYLNHQNDDQISESDYESDEDQSFADEECLGRCLPSHECYDNERDGIGAIDPRTKKYHKCPSGQVCCIDEESNEEYEKCGISPSTGVKNRIVSSAINPESEFGEYPWMAIVLKYEHNINKYICGAVLIDSLHVLTAAHCLQGLERCNIKVRLGEWNTQSTNEAFLHKDFSAEKAIIHQKFNNKSLHNDIAIIKLSKEVEFEPHIRPVCLPKPKQIFTNQWCVTTGWGKNALEGGKYANILKEVVVPVIDSHLCQELLRKTKLGRRFVLNSGFLCAGGQEGRDSCKGDGGGPLVCQQNDGSFTLAGLVSWGIDCGESGVPGIYSNVEKFMPFISQKTGIPLNERI